MSRGRFAPSPTGDLHLGNARTALAAWLAARSRGSSFVMRVEDLDRPRTVPHAIEGNLAELRWLGLDWDEGPDVGGPHAPYRQSQREKLFDLALTGLQERGLVFECYLSRRELREISSAPHGSAPVYGERERRMNERVAERKRAGGKEPALRLKAPPGSVEFVDGLFGRQRFEIATDVGDIVLRRADGAWAYGFAVVVDDLAMEIEEVVRGADLLPATAAQLVVCRALGRRPPRFLHLPLLLDEAGQRLSKRKGSLTLSSLRESGIEPERVVGLLAKGLGLVAGPTPLRPHDLVERFASTRLPVEPAVLGEREIAWLRSGRPG